MNNGRKFSVSALKPGTILVFLIQERENDTGPGFSPHGVSWVFYGSHKGK